jgi:hypothetical protein
MRETRPTRSTATGRKIMSSGLRKYRNTKSITISQLSLLKISVNMVDNIFQPKIPGEMLYFIK